MNKPLFYLIGSLAMFAHLHGKYDPSETGPVEFSQFAEMEVYDQSRERTIPIRVYLPNEESSPVVLFSHGLGGSRMNNSYLGEHWSSHGYAVVYLQHIGSDESVWKDIPRKERMDSLKNAASAKNAVARFGDVSAVLDALEKWNSEPENALHGKFDLTRVGMSGHSFGANTTQGVSGQSFNWGRNFTDERIDAAVAFSPNSPGLGRKADRAFRDVQIPWLLMTGTKDLARVGKATVETRLAVFPALPEGDKYELVFHEGEHHAFSDGGGRNKKRNPNHHPAILAISLAFWDTYLLEHEEAGDWLQTGGPESVLEEMDRWQMK